MINRQIEKLLKRLDGRIVSGWEKNHMQVVEGLVSDLNCKKKQLQKSKMLHFFHLLLLLCVVFGVPTYLTTLEHNSPSFAIVVFIFLVFVLLWGWSFRRQSWNKEHYERMIGVYDNLLKKFRDSCYSLEDRCEYRPDSLHLSLEIVERNLVLIACNLLAKEEDYENIIHTYSSGELKCTLESVHSKSIQWAEAKEQLNRLWRSATEDFGLVFNKKEIFQQAASEKALLTQKS